MTDIVEYFKVTPRQITYPDLILQASYKIPKNKFMYKVYQPDVLQALIAGAKVEKKILKTVAKERTGMYRASVDRGEGFGKDRESTSASGSEITDKPDKHDKHGKHAEKQIEKEKRRRTASELETSHQLREREREQGGAASHGGNDSSGSGQSGKESHHSKDKDPSLKASKEKSPLSLSSDQSLQSPRKTRNRIRTLLPLSHDLSSSFPCLPALTR